MSAARNVALYPWFKFFQNLMFWQAIWFLFFQSELSAADAVLIYVASEISTTALEVPSGYLSDRAGRRLTLILSAIAGLAAGLLQAFGDGFWMFALAQVAIGAHFAFASGTDSSLLYESLAEDGRQDEIEYHELKAWRFSFVALAISAVAGGAMALWGLRLPYFATAAAFSILLVLTLVFRDPKTVKRLHSERARLSVLARSFHSPILIWLFAMWVLMYGFSHLPFVFGQPIVLSELDGFGLAENAPLVSGAVTALMLVISLATSWVAPSVRTRLGLVGILLIAFAFQIGLVAALAFGSGALAISLLLLRKVPESLSRPFMLARMQMELSDEVRATYLSIQSLVAKLVYSTSLFFAAGSASTVGVMPYSEIRNILIGYALVGVVGFVALAMTARKNWSAPEPR